MNDTVGLLALFGHSPKMIPMTYLSFSKIIAPAENQAAFAY
jgi:hypothetical protein